jgi:hypothetical protein
VRDAATLPSSFALARRGGFDVFEGLLDRYARECLLRESLARFSTAERTDVLTQQDDEEMRGGNPARAFWSAGGGEFQTALYGAQWFLAFVGETIGRPVKRTGSRATYTYYGRGGDHLSVHRDVRTCDVAVISCLQDNAASASRGGLLCLYPERIGDPLAEIRASRRRGSLLVRLQPGQTLVILGGHVPHAVLPVEPGQSRIVSVMCYEVTSDS